MKNSTFRLLFLQCFVALLGNNNLIWAQANEPKGRIIDDWPVTVKTNVNRGRGNEGDFQANFVTFGSKWNHRIITYFFQNQTYDLSTSDQRNAIRLGLSFWAGNSDLAFLEICDAASADIIFLFATGDHGDGATFSGRNGALAHATPPPPIGDGDVHFDDAEDWVAYERSGSSQPIDLVYVATHETGHALGLNHTTVSGSIMGDTYYGSQRYLGSDDIAGIQSLYGSKNGGQLLSGPQMINFSSSANYTLNDVPSGTTVTWQAYPPNAAYTSSVSGSGNSVNLTTANGSFGGKGSITFNITKGCNNTVINRDFWIGNPGLQDMTYGTQGNGPTNFVYTTNSISANTWYVIRTNTELAQLTSGANWSTNASINGYSPYQGEYRLNLSPGQSVNLTVSASNQYGSSIRTITFYAPSYYRVAPNPAQNTVGIEFDKVDYLEALPEQIDLLNEASTNPIKSLNIKQIYEDQSFKQSKKVMFDVKDLPRGVYYLHVKNSRNKEKQVDAIRIILN